MWNPKEQEPKKDERPSQEVSSSAWDKARKLKDMAQQSPKKEEKPKFRLFGITGATSTDGKMSSTTAWPTIETKKGSISFGPTMIEENDTGSQRDIHNTRSIVGLSGSFSFWWPESDQKKKKKTK